MLEWYFDKTNPDTGEDKLDLPYMHTADSFILSFNTIRGLINDTKLFGRDSDLHISDLNYFQKITQNVGKLQLQLTPEIELDGAVPLRNKSFTFTETIKYN